MLLGVLALAVVFPIASTIAPTSAIIDDSTYSLHLETSNSIDLTLNPVTAGALSVAKDTVTGSTNSPSGYKLYISTASDTADISLNTTNTPNLTTGANIIRATSGTYNNPSALTLTSAQNAVWGYAVPGLGNFDASYSTDSPATSAKFAAVPTLGNEQLVHTHAGAATNDTTDIYYGVKANLGLASGNYKGSIRYLTVTDISSGASGEAQITIGGGAAELTEYYAATTAEITTSLKTDIDLSNSTIQATIGNQTCANPTIITQSPSLKLPCTIPTGLTDGKYDVIVNVVKLGKSYTITEGVKVNKRKFNVAFNVAGNSAGYGTVSANAINDVVDGTAITINSDTVTIGGTTITATPTAQSAQYNYSFSSWTNNCGNTVTGNCTITANFTMSTRSYTITIESNNTNYGTVSPTSLSKTYGTTLPSSGGTATSITIGGTTITATAKTNYKLKNWTHSCGSTLTGACTITANFESAIVTFDQAFASASKSKVSGTDYYAMQDMTASICSAVSKGQTGTLIDTRSGNEAYLVGKFADGKCWMLDNLRLGGTSAIKLTTSDTHINSNWTLPASGSWTSSSQNSYTAAYIAASGSSWDKNTAQTQVSGSLGSGKNGVYYNYCAASAGTICSSSNYSNATYDICPKGWRLPTSGEYQALSSACSNNATNFKKALSTPLSGVFRSGSAYSQGSIGYFWSSTRYNDTFAYLLYVDSSRWYPANVYDRKDGYSVRCVAQ